jgi:hypothetical protein
MVVLCMIRIPFHSSPVLQDSLLFFKLLAPHLTPHFPTFTPSIPHPLHTWDLILQAEYDISTLGKQLVMKKEKDSRLEVRKGRSRLGGGDVSPLTPFS